MICVCPDNTNMSCRYYGVCDIWLSRVYFFITTVYPDNLMESKSFYWIYILRVAGDRYYTGYTTDIYRRYIEHQSGSRKSRFTRSFPPEKIEQCWKVFADRGTTMFVERFIKKKNHQVKERLINQPQLLQQEILKACGKDIQIQVIGPDVYSRTTG